MSELQIDDLSFCEFANDSQVQGGFLYLLDTNSIFVSSLFDSKLYDLDSIESIEESLVKGLSEQELDTIGQLKYRMESKDGKKLVVAVARKIGDINFSAIAARIKS
jgi:hypothetical protein